MTQFTWNFHRCLVEGGGNVAFVKHTTVTENCDGKRKEWWARNQLTSDYELLCRDGTRAPARDYQNCYLGKVKANAIITNPKIGEGKLNAFINLFKYAQQFYGQKVPDQFSFSMFYSQPPYADLIFQVECDFFRYPNRLLVNIWLIIKICNFFLFLCHYIFEISWFKHFL